MRESTYLQTIAVRGADLNYVESGSGEPVVLVHGSLGDYRSWSLQMGPFAEHYRVIAYSRRYHFPNEAPGGASGDGRDYSAALHADDLIAFLDVLQLPNAHLVTASYGSYCGLVVARHHSERVASLVVAEPPMLHWVRELPGGEALVRPFVEGALTSCREAFLARRDEEAVRLFIDGVIGRAGAFDSLHPPIRRTLLDNAAEMRAECLSDRLFPHFICGDAARIPVPTLLLSGDRSPAFFHRITEELSRCLPTSEMVTIPGASHNLNSARPRLYNQVVLDFLLRHP